MNKSVYVLMACTVAFLSSCEGFLDPDAGHNTKEVKAQFVFNVATLSGRQTKQSATETQVGTSTSTAVFRGITGANLMTLARGVDKDGTILSEDVDADRVYDLSSVVGPGTISAANSRRVLEMSLPLGTNTLIFYGKAMKSTIGTDSFSADDSYGKLDAYTVSDKANETIFTLGKRLNDETGFYAAEKLLADILTIVMHTNLAGANHVAIPADGHPEQNANTYKYGLAAGDYQEITWSDYVNSSNQSPVDIGKSLHPLEEKLAHLYKQMTTIRYDGNAELRAGSGEATLRIVKDLWSVINSVRCDDPTCEADAVAKFFAERVHIRLKNYFAGTYNGEGTAVTSVGFGSSILTNFQSATEQADLPDAAPKLTAAELTALESIDLSKFPSSFNIPVGAAFIAYNTTDKYFYYPSVFNTSAMGTSGASYNAENYYFPAELLYFANSPVRTSATEHKATDYPQTTSEWASDWTADWTGSHVESSTRSVAMKYDIDYGVSMLETKVGYKTTTLKDNRHAVMKLDTPTLGDDEELDQTITVDDGSFILTGLIIGGQPVNVGWNFLPVGTQDGFIYDRAIHPASQAIPTTGTSESNYTVVFDNYVDGLASDQESVTVALEFKNNTGKDFYGNYNIIQDGGHFYLLGTLKPGEGSGLDSAAAWPTDHIVPPYNTDGTSKKIRRVFVQDFMTTVSFKFGENSLKYAYLTVPDLRASSLSLGLSVDITWKQGIVYDEIIIGGN